MCIRDRPMYISTPLIIIPVICGFVLPIISLYYLTNYNWIALSIINLIFVLITKQLITRAYLLRLSSGVLGKDIFYTLCLGITTLILGIILS